jgi:hypothetical protein
MRSLSIVSLAQRMITLSRSCTNASRYCLIFFHLHSGSFIVAVLELPSFLVCWSIAETHDTL